MRRDVSIPSHGQTLAAWHYRPSAEAESGTRAPCIVLAHGFGGTRENRLAPFAERFSEAGFHALVFDYRHFGSSGGSPRQLVSVAHQLEDWASAVDFARRLDGVDPERVALWGTSFSGGHVITTAARDPRIAAVSAQAPVLDGLAASMASMRRAGPARALRMTAHGVWDAIRGALGLSPHMLPIAGPEGSLAIMSTPDAQAGIAAIATETSCNDVAARILLWMGMYRPVQSARDVRCPLLLQICERDTLVPPEAAEEAARTAQRSEVIRYPIGHFDVYLGADFERAVTDQLAFFRRHLQGATTARGARSESKVTSSN